MAAYIFLKDIGKKNKNDIVIADLSLGLEKGKKLAIVGSNNSGKSMLLRILAGIIKADFGTIFIDGKEFLSNSKEIKKQYAIYLSTMIFILIYLFMIIYLFI